MKILKVITVVFFSILVISCASNQRTYVAPQYTSVLYGKRISSVIREGGVFRGLGRGSAVSLGPVGALVGSGKIGGRKNNRAVNYYNLRDPAQDISQQVVQVLTRRYQLQNVGGTITKAKDDRTVPVAANSDLVLDIKTVNWGVYKYVSQLKLIDIKSTKVLAQGSCTFDANKNSRSAGVRKVDLLANNAALLKNRMEEAKSYCINRFINMLLGQRR